MIICNNCGSPGIDGRASCPECGARTPLGSGPEPPTLQISAGGGSPQLGTAATVNLSEINPPPSNAQASPFPVFATGGPRHIQPDAQAPRIHADEPARSPRTALIVAVSAGATICVLALGFIAVRTMLKGSDGNENPNPASAAHAATTPSATSQNAGPASLPENLKIDEPVIKREVTETLNGWAAAAQAHDLDEDMSYYAPVLDNYYQRSNVSADFVRADRARAYSRFTKLDIKLSNIEVTPDPAGTRATAVFDKTYHFEGDKFLSGSVRELAWLRKIGGRWLISGEKALQVYYVNH